MEEDDTESERARGLGGTTGAVFVPDRFGRPGDSNLGEVCNLPMACSQSNGTVDEGLAADGTEMFSNDSTMLAVSKSAMLLSASRVHEGGLGIILCTSTLPPSDERETEWKEEMDDAGACTTRPAPNLCAPGG